jgi:hypothetical protein
MVASKSDIRRFWKRFEPENHSHMIVVCDTYDYDDYPVFVPKNKDVNEVIEDYRNKSMQRVMEVYSGSIDFEKQLKEDQCWNL